MKTIIFAAALLLIAGRYTYAQAQVPDQADTNFTMGLNEHTGPGFSFFQAFTAGISGTLTQVSMGVHSVINGAGTLRLYTGGDTNGTLLQTLPVMVVCATGDCFVNFQTSIPVKSGQMYTFRFTPGAGIPDNYVLRVEGPGTYPGGEMGLIDNDGTFYLGIDLNFKTYVLPSTGLHDSNLNQGGFNISPNPFAMAATLQFDEPVTSAVITISGINGQVVSLIEKFSGNTLRIERGNLPAGLYFVTISANNRLAKPVKLIIEN